MKPIGKCDLSYIVIPQYFIFYGARLCAAAVLTLKLEFVIPCLYVSQWFGAIFVARMTFLKMADDILRNVVASRVSRHTHIEGILPKGLAAYSLSLI